jgi:hypothetical protein
LSPTKEYRSQRFQHETQRWPEINAILKSSANNPDLLPILADMGIGQSISKPIITILSGWWLTYPSEKYQFVSWDHYSQYMEKYKMFQTTNLLCFSRGVTRLLTHSRPLPIIVFSTQSASFQVEKFGR